jgi:hypothetical protein
VKWKSDDDGVPAEVFRFSGGGVLALKRDAYTQLGRRCLEVLEHLELFLEFRLLLSKCF